MQYKVPQNIDMADRIVGPLTLIQFLYVMIGGVIDYILFSILGPTSPALFFLIGGPIALLALAFAFLKVQDQPFSHFFLAFWTYLSRPKQRIWGRMTNNNQITIVPDAKTGTDHVATKTVNQAEIAKLAQVLDRGMTPVNPLGARGAGATHG